MNRTWIAALSIAGVAGTGGAAYAGLVSPAPAVEPSPETTLAPSVTETTLAPIHRVIDFQIGGAATVRVEQLGDTLSIVGVAASTGWASLGTSGGGAHVEALVGDGLQLVTFSADLVDGEIVPSVSVAADPSVTSTSEPVATTTPGITVITVLDETTPVMPADPVDTTAPVTTTPGPETTTAPSGEHDDDHDEDDDDHDEDEDDD